MKNYEKPTAELIVLNIDENLMDGGGGTGTDASIGVGDSSH